MAMVAFRVITMLRQVYFSSSYVRHRTIESLSTQSIGLALIDALALF